MALADLLEISKDEHELSPKLRALLDLPENKKKIGVSADRIDKIKSELRQWIAFWREYPDLFVDFMQTGGDTNKKLTFNLLAYQRVFLRVGMRYKYVYAVYPRESMCALQ